MLPTKVHRFHGYCHFTRGARAENWCIWLSCQELYLYLIFNAFSLMQYKLPSLGHICLIMKPYAIQTKILLYTFWCQNLTGALPLNSFNTVSYVQYFLSIFFLSNVSKNMTFYVGFWSFLIFSYHFYNEFWEILISTNEIMTRVTPLIQDLEIICHKHPF